jgi:hypothetical protein
MSVKPKPVAKLPFLGQMRDVYQSNSNDNLSFNGSEFFAGKNLLNSTTKLNQRFDDLAKKYLQKIIQKEINKLRNKVIKTPITYKQGNKTFTKEERVSINSYLKKIGFSQKISFEIGKSDKEWGINKLGKGKKEFSLFFNLNLVKYDSGEHIAYVVAHELCHVFHRNHGPEFQQTLKRLYSKKTKSESFFKYGIKNVFKNSAKNQASGSGSSNLLLIVFLVGVVIFCYLVFWWLSQTINFNQSEYLF